MQIAIEKSNSIERASALTRQNMLTYYQARSIVWDQRKYESSWSEFENFDVKYQGKWVGVIRFSRDDDVFYIRDIQISSTYQNLGIGFSCLSYAIEKAKVNNLRYVKLRVFSENPALNLYKKFGFKDRGEFNGLIEMEILV